MAVATGRGGREAAAVVLVAAAGRLEELHRSEQMRPRGMPREALGPVPGEAGGAAEGKPPEALRMPPIKAGATQEVDSSKQTSPMKLVAWVTLNKSAPAMRERQPWGPVELMPLRQAIPSYCKVRLGKGPRLAAPVGPEGRAALMADLATSTQVWAEPMA